jgi:hypothetical protein
LLCAFALHGLLSSHDVLQFAGSKRHRGSGLEDHVGATPGSIVDQLPAMAGPNGVFGKQDIARVQQEVLTAPGLKIQSAT